MSYKVKRERIYIYKQNKNKQKMEKPKHSTMRQGTSQDTIEFLFLLPIHCWAQAYS